MSRRPLLSVAALVAAAALARADEPKGPKVIAAASAPAPTLVKLKADDSGVVIRGPEELVAHTDRPDAAKNPDAQKAAVAELTKLLKVDAIDWKTQTVLAVRGHPGPGSMSSIKFDPPVGSGKLLLVVWTQEDRATRAVYRDQPTGFLLVERFDGEARFLPKERTNAGGVSLVLVPAGTFTMGSPPGEEDRLAEERPHEVEITRPFHMGRFEVTIGQFKAFVADTGYRTEAERDAKGGRGFDGKEFVYKPEFTWKKLYFDQTDYHPVVVVSWTDATAYCEWLTRKDGRPHRLPTEAEWEYACRAGTTTRFHAGDKDDDLKPHGNIADAALQAKWRDAFWAVKWDDGHPFTSPIARFRPNAFGLFDLHGNAWEWSGDWYAEDSYRASPRRDPRGPAAGTDRVARGGAWSTQPKFCRCAYRDWHEPTYRSDCVGFRVVAPVDD